MLSKFIDDFFDKRTVLLFEREFTGKNPIIIRNKAFGIIWVGDTVLLFRVKTNLLLMNKIEKTFDLELTSTRFW